MWRHLAKVPGIAGAFKAALSHREIANYQFSASDEVWVLSFSRDENENSALLDAMARAGRIIYFNSAAANIAPITRCYRYPTVKALAADYARHRHGATIVHLGFVYENVDELPAGITAAVNMRQLVDFFIRGMPAEETDLELFEMIEHPYRHKAERWLHVAYDRLQRACGSYPCILRPLDVLLRAVGCKWYGYMNLSNRLWLTTIS